MIRDMLRIYGGVAIVVFMLASHSVEAAQSAGPDAIAGLVITCPCVAYLGPGAGLTTIGALLAVLGMIALALLGPVLYPIRLIRRRMRERRLAQSLSSDVARSEDKT